MRSTRGVRVLVLAVALATAAACGGGSGGGGSDEAADGKYGSELLDEQVTTTLAPGSTVKPGAQTPETIIRKKQSGAGGSAGASGSAETPSGEDPVYVASRKANGAFAGPLLRPAPKGAKKIVYQLMVQSGKDPAPASVDHVVGMLRRVSGKTVEVTKVDLPGGQEQWTEAQLHTYADRFTKQKSSVDAAVLNVLFVRGRNAKSESILGVASRADVLTMYPDQYRNLGAGLNPQAIETAVLMHETGHILSLVGSEVRPERQDKDHPGHSTNKASVMYWAVETDDIISAFVGAPPKEFDREDLADLEMIRNS